MRTANSPNDLERERRKVQELAAMPRPLRVERRQLQIALTTNAALLHSAPSACAKVSSESEDNQEVAKSATGCH